MAPTSFPFVWQLGKQCRGLLLFGDFFFLPFFFFVFFSSQRCFGACLFSLGTCRTVWQFLSFRVFGGGTGVIVVVLCKRNFSLCCIAYPGQRCYQQSLKRGVQRSHCCVWAVHKGACRVAYSSFHRMSRSDGRVTLAKC